VRPDWWTARISNSNTRQRVATRRSGSHIRGSEETPKFEMKGGFTVRLQHDASASGKGFERNASGKGFEEWHRQRLRALSCCQDLRVPELRDEFSVENSTLAGPYRHSFPTLSALRLRRLLRLALHDHCPSARGSREKSLDTNGLPDA